MCGTRIDGNTYFRNEKSGLTVYHVRENIFSFYEGWSAESYFRLPIEQRNAIPSDDNVDLTYPFFVCCLVENTCNLDCLYCFGDDKMYSHRKNINVEEMYSRVADLRPLVVSLGGGEPTFNPNLSEIIRFFYERNIAVLLDTNGTTSDIPNLVDTFLKYNVMVRVSIDSLDDSIIRIVRPYRDRRVLCQSEAIKENISLMKKRGVNLGIQSVISKYNINCLHDIGDYLADAGIDRWHLAGVKYSEKCKDFYSDFCISKGEALTICTQLLKHFPQILITLSYEDDYGKNARLFYDVNGEFLTDSILNGLSYLGHNPSKESLYNSLDKSAHIKRYLGNFYQHL